MRVSGFPGFCYRTILNVQPNIGHVVPLSFWSKLPFTVQVLDDTFTEIPQIGWLSEGAFLTSTCFTEVSTLIFYRRLSADFYSRT